MTEQISSSSRWYEATVWSSLSGQAISKQSDKEQEKQRIKRQKEKLDFWTAEEQALYKVVQIWPGLICM